MDATSLKRIAKGKGNDKRSAYQAQIKQIYDSTRGDVKVEIG